MKDKKRFSYLNWIPWITRASKTSLSGYFSSGLTPMKMASKKMKTKTAAAIVMTRQKDWFRLNLLRMKYGKRRYKVLAIDILKDPFIKT